MLRLKLLTTLRPAGVWLILLMGLAFVQPLLGMAGHAPEGTSRHLEFTAADFSAELLNSPVEHSRSAKQELNCPESESVASRLVQADLLLPNRPDYQHIVINSSWFASSHPLFLPRPPPHS